MEDSNNSGNSNLGEEADNLIVAAERIARALGSKKDLSDEERRVLADLGNKLSAISVISDHNDHRSANEGEEHLSVLQEKIMSLEASHSRSMIWDSSQEGALEYLNSVDEIRRLIGLLENSCNGDESGLLSRAHDVFQTAMARVEEEFRHMLLQNRPSYEPESLSFRSSEEDVMDEGSSVSFGASSFDESFRRDSESRTSDERIIDLVNPDVIPDLRCIANLMCNSSYGLECSEAYIDARRCAVDEYLSILEIEKLSIEDVLRLEWNFLNYKIKRWVRALKVFVRVYLTSERLLSDQIFGEQSLNLDCFIEASKAAMLQLLNFAKAICIGPHRPEKLVCILDMYEVMANLLPDVSELYQEEAGSFVMVEYQEVLLRVSESVRIAFWEFESAIASHVSTSAFAGGGPHPLTRWVMNHVNILTDYREILDSVLKVCEVNKSASSSPEMESPTLREEPEENPRQAVSEMALHFHKVATILLENLGEKSKLYGDPALQHVFLMNNIHYMVEKVKNSYLRHVFGGEWIRKHSLKVQQHELKYERETWGPILSMLKDDGLHSLGSNSISKSLLKERLRGFALAFEEVYKAQTAWIIPDTQLRENLRILISVKLIQAYRSFLGRCSNLLYDKNIKYGIDDLEDYLSHLFEGSPRSLQSSYRR